MKANQVFEAISSRIANSSQFLYSCFGSNEPRNYEFVDVFEKPIGSFTSDKSGKVYEVVVEIPSKNRCYRWLDPKFKEALFQETQMRGFDPDIAWDEVIFTEIEEEKDILEKLTAICNGEEFDERVEVPLELSDETFLAVAKEAHERDITFNEMVSLILKTKIKAATIEEMLANSENIKTSGCNLNAEEIEKRIMAGGMENMIMKVIESGELEKMKLTTEEEFVELSKMLSKQNGIENCEEEEFDKGCGGCYECSCNGVESEPTPVAPVKKFSSF